MADFYYVVCALDGYGQEGPISAEVGPIDDIEGGGILYHNFSWDAIPGVSDYRVFGGNSSGVYDQYWDVSGTAFMWFPPGSSWYAGDGTPTSGPNPVAGLSVEASKIGKSTGFSGTDGRDMWRVYHQLQLTSDVPSIHFGSNTSMTIKHQSGNFEIGDTTYIDGALKVNREIGETGYGDLYVYGDVNIGTGFAANNPPTNGLQVEGPVRLGMTTGYDALNVTGTVDIEGSVDISDDLYVETGSIYLEGTDPHIYFDSTSNYLWYDTSEDEFHFYGASVHVTHNVNNRGFYLDTQAAWKRGPSTGDNYRLQFTDFVWIEYYSPWPDYDIHIFTNGGSERAVFGEECYINGNNCNLNPTYDVNITARDLDIDLTGDMELDGGNLIVDDTSGITLAGGKISRSWQTIYTMGAANIVNVNAYTFGYHSDGYVFMAGRSGYSEGRIFVPLHLPYECEVYAIKLRCNMNGTPTQFAGRVLERTISGTTVHWNHSLTGTFTGSWEWVDVDQGGDPSIMVSGDSTYTLSLYHSSSTPTMNISHIKIWCYPSEMAYNRY